MSIAIPKAILHYSLLLPPALKCLHMHQFSRNHPENYFLACSVVYLFDLYDAQATRPVEGVYVLVSPAYFIYVPIMYAFWAKITYISSYILYLCKLLASMTPGSPEGEQGIPGISPGRR